MFAGPAFHLQYHSARQQAVSSKLSEGRKTVGSRASSRVARIKLSTSHSEPPSSSWPPRLSWDRHGRNTTSFLKWGNLKPGMGKSPASVSTGGPLSPVGASQHWGEALPAANTTTATYLHTLEPHQLEHRKTLLMALCTLLAMWSLTPYFTDRSR